jgi:hypothetical protein
MADFHPFFKKKEKQLSYISKIEKKHFTKLKKIRQKGKL